MPFVLENCYHNISGIKGDRLTGLIHFALSGLHQERNDIFDGIGHHMPAIRK